jgi:uncharacterized protein (TIGR02145 family)
MKKKSLLLTAVATIGLIAATIAQTPGNGVSDFDGNNYSTVIIGNQEWISENLRTSHYSNGESILNETNIGQWSSLTSGAWVNYNNDSQFENIYGKLYNWYAVIDTRNICPSGWHVPSDLDWNELIGFIDPNYNPTADAINATNGVQSETAGGKMKSLGTQYWASPNYGATNESGFSGLPGGNLESPVSFWNAPGFFGDFWSSTLYPNSSSYAFQRKLRYEDGAVIRVGRDITMGLSVRCVKNNISETNDFQIENLSIYPNPAQNLINVKADLKLIGASYTIIDNTGRGVLSGQISSENIIVDIGNLKEGVYMFKVNNEAERTFRIVKN